jgi:hypothetical protein
MSKKNRNMHVVALQTTLATVQAEKAALAETLATLGYCHEQQTLFITESMSGPDGVISKETLLREAVNTNKDLTDELEFQAHRYGLQKKALGHANKTCAQLQDQVTELTADRYWSRLAAYALGSVLAIGICYHIGAWV